MQKTQNYNLNQWESTDPIRREDFNADNAAIDAALNSLNTAVGSKAEQSAVTTLSQKVAGAWSADNVPWVFGTLDLTGVAIGDVITISDFEPTLLVMWTRLDIPGLATSGYELRVRRHNTGSYHDFLFEGNTLTVTDMNGEPSTTVQYMLLK